MNEKIERRSFLKNSALAAAVGIYSMIPKNASSEVVSKKHGGKKFKVIDYRCRPPLKQFGGLYKMRLGYIAQRPNVIGNPATHGKIPEAVKLFGKGKEEEAFKMWWKEIDDLGLESVVVAGRIMMGQPNMTMGTDELLKYERKFPGRFY
jgi:hypothetical protein